MTKNFIFAVATLVGATVGLGMFGIPYTASKAGFFIAGVYLVALGGVMMILHLIIGEIVERTRGKHRLTGYIEKYLGLTPKRIVGAIIVFGIYAALLAYIIVAGKFLAIIMQDLASPFVLGLIFWGFMSAAVIGGIRTIGAAELVMTALLLLFIGLIFLWGAGDIAPKNLAGFNPAAFFLPYGVIIFALDGSVAIPEIRELLKGDGASYKRAIIIGSFIPIVVYFLFMTLVLGVSGAHTSEEALRGLSGYVGSGAITLGAVFGMLAIATSYLALGSNLKHTFEYDWNIKKNFAGLLVVIVPAIAFIAGVQKFIEVISFSGAVLAAVIAIFTILVYRKAKKFGDQTPGYALRLPSFVLWGLIVLLALGGVYEMMYVIW